jgi:uncharacterized protein (TIGR02246 family)
MHRPTWQILVSAFLMAGCGSSKADESSRVPADDHASVKAAIDSMNRAAYTATLRRDAAAYVSVFTPDVTIMGNDGNDVHGRQALETSMRERWTKRDQTDTLLWVEWHADTVEAHGTYAYEVGQTMSVRRPKLAPQAKPDTTRSRYITFWKKDSDGTWRAARDFSVPLVVAQK